MANYTIKLKKGSVEEFIPVKTTDEKKARDVFESCLNKDNLRIGKLGALITSEYSGGTIMLLRLEKNKSNVVCKKVIKF